VLEWGQLLVLMSTGVICCRQDLAKSLLLVGWSRVERRISVLVRLRSIRRYMLLLNRRQSGKPCQLLLMLNINCKESGKVLLGEQGLNNLEQGRRINMLNYRLLGSMRKH
jgi:hypothetical protein